MCIRVLSKLVLEQIRFPIAYEENNFDGRFDQFKSVAMIFYIKSKSLVQKEKICGKVDKSITSTWDKNYLMIFIDNDDKRKN